MHILASANHFDETLASTAMMQTRGALVLVVVLALAHAGQHHDWEPNSVSRAEHHQWRKGLGNQMKCACDPVKNPSKTVTCVKHEHKCWWNHHNHKHISESPEVGSKFWWSSTGPDPISCTGTSQHSSIQVEHAAATGLGSDDRGGSIHGKPHAYHHCKMVSKDECSCCDCDRPKPQKYCWGRKVHGELAWQGPGPGFDGVAAAGTRWRKERCLTRVGVDERECRLACEAIEDCEAVYVHGGGKCTLARLGCLNRGCRVQQPIGSNAYRNGCYHSPVDYPFVTTLKIAQRTDASSGGFTQLRTLPDGAGKCANEGQAQWEAARATGTNGADVSTESP